MRILLDITHPAHLHFFRHAIATLRDQGHELRLTARDKDILRQLAGEMNIDMTFFGGTPAGVPAMARTLAYRKARLAGVVARFRPQVLAALGGTFIGALGWALRVPNVVFYDTENATLSNRITYPFASRVCTPRAYLHDVPRQVHYAGYHESAYLSPRVFRPDPGVRGELGVGDGEPYAILRFVGWRASHDLGMHGLGPAVKRRIVEQLRRHGRVFISSEGPLPEDLEALRFPLPSKRMHDALAFAAVLVAESSTMCSEAAVLGVPSVFIYPPIPLGYTKEQAERWGIVHWIHPPEAEAAIRCAVELMQDRDRQRWREIGRAIEADSVDVSAFIVSQILEVGRQGRRGRR